MHKLAHPLGEVIVSKICEKFQLPFAISTLSTTSLDLIAENSPNTHKWLQIYIAKDRSITLKMIRKAEMLNFTAVVITVDSPFIAQRPGDKRKNHLPADIQFEILKDFREELVDSYRKSINYNKDFENRLDIMFNDQRDATLTFNDIKWLQSITKLPIILKGIQSVEDAIKSLDMKISAIWISNHGGRQLDQGLSTIKILAAVSEIIGGRMEIYVDGGIRRGTDVIKCLALGARCVFLGRPLIYAQACSGEDGVNELVNILMNEINQSMKLLGLKSISEINKNCLIKPYVSKL